MSTAPTSRQFTGRHMLAIMVTWFGIVIAVNITMAVLANTSWTGLLAKNGYVASIDFKKDEEARAAAAERGWDVAATADGEHVTIHAVNANGSVLPLSMFGEAAPRDPRADVIAIELQQTPSGARTVDPLPEGEWIIRFRVGDGEERLVWRNLVTIEP